MDTENKRVSEEAGGIQFIVELLSPTIYSTLPPSPLLKS
jgi:hypothetical protein